jgi:hypothetical protein
VIENVIAGMLTTYMPRIFFRKQPDKSEIIGANIPRNVNAGAHFMSDMQHSRRP